MMDRIYIIRALRQNSEKQHFGMFEMTRVVSIHRLTEFLIDFMSIRRIPEYPATPLYFFQFQSTFPFVALGLRASIQSFKGLLKNPVLGVGGMEIHAAADTKPVPGL